ncbi:unnamed protein product, partial [Discosporangium mesarthrocarpum]
MRRTTLPHYRVPRPGRPSNRSRVCSLMPLMLLGMCIIALLWANLAFMTDKMTDSKTGEGGEGGQGEVEVRQGATGMRQEGSFDDIEGKEGTGLDLRIRGEGQEEGGGIDANTKDDGEDRASSSSAPAPPAPTPGSGSPIEEEKPSGLGGKLKGEGEEEEGGGGGEDYRPQEQMTSSGRGGVDTGVELQSGDYGNHLHKVVGEGVMEEEKKEGERLSKTVVSTSQEKMSFAVEEGLGAR